MFNKVVLIGNLTRDIELRFAPQSGTAIARTGLAVTRRYNVGGERREETCFIDVTFWGRTAEIANQYLHKGSKVLVEGRLRFEQWQDQNGQNRSKHSVEVENMEMLDSKNSGDGNPVQNNFGGNNGYNGNGGGYQNRGNYQNNGYSQNSANNYAAQNRAPAQTPKNEPEPYKEDLPEIDVDADETIPF